MKLSKANRTLQLVCLRTGVNVPQHMWDSVIEDVFKGFRVAKGGVSCFSEEGVRQHCFIQFTSRVAHPQPPLPNTLPPTQQPSTLSSNRRTPPRQLLRAREESVPATGTTQPPGPRRPSQLPHRVQRICPCTPLPHVATTGTGNSEFVHEPFRASKANVDPQ